MRNDSMVAAAATGLAVVGLFSYPSVSGLIRQLRKRDPKQETYEDLDGKSTPEAVKAYSAKPPKALLLLFSALGCGTAIALAVLSTLHVAEDGSFLENWLSAASWVSSPQWFQLNEQTYEKLYFAFY